MEQSTDMIKSLIKYANLTSGNPSLEREGYSCCSYQAGQWNPPQTRWVCLIYLILTGEMPTILQRGKISPRLLTKPTFPPKPQLFQLGKNDTMGKSHPLVIGKGMRSAGSTNAHCS